MSDSANEVNKLKESDIAFATGKGLIGMIPILGALASELFGSIVTPPLEKRRKEWMQDIGERLQALEEEDKIDINALRTNEQFIDVVLQATSLALKTSQQVKIQAFKNIITNTAEGIAPDETKSQIFLSLVDAFTPWHLKILHLFDDPKQWFRENNLNPPNLYQGSLSRVIADAFHELNGEDELTDLIWNDLKQAGLHNTGSIRASISSDGMMSPRTSKLGKEFISFISKH